MLSDELFVKYRVAFDALEEFDRTGVMPSLGRKVRVNVTLDAQTLQRFRVECGGAKLSTTLNALLCREVESKHF